MTLKIGDYISSDDIPNEDIFDKLILTATSQGMQDISWSWERWSRCKHKNPHDTLRLVVIGQGDTMLLYTEHLVIQYRVRRNINEWLLPAVDLIRYKSGNVITNPRTTTREEDE